MISTQNIPPADRGDHMELAEDQRPRSLSSSSVEDDTCGRICNQQFLRLLQRKDSCAAVASSSIWSRRSSVNETTLTGDTLFNVLKDKKRNRVPISKLFSIIEEVGVLLTDPRLKECMNNIAQLQKVSMKNEELAKNSYFLDKEKFKGVIAENVVMLHRILQNDFIIPEFKMFCDEIDEIYNLCKLNMQGQPANYIPQLARFDPNLWGLGMCTVDGQRYALGDSDHAFCVQSACKPLNYALALTDLGPDVVHQFVGYEPSGVSFNSISLNDERKPHNPLINSGAICVISLLKTKMTLADRFDYVIQEYKRMAGYEYIGFSNSTFLSERATADRNFAISYYMKENQCFPDGSDLMETLDFYFQLCSVEVTCESGSVIAATLANGGICPLTGERVLSGEAVRNTLSLMYSCGMYDYSGQFAFKVGLPAKSGVSGIVLLVIPNLLGMCLWSPPLGKLGNSKRCIQFCQELVARFNFHNYDSLIHTAGDKLKKDPRKAKIETRSQEIVSLLFGAYNNDVTALRRVYMSDVNMSQCDYDGRTALHVAAAEGHLECVEFLIETCCVDPYTTDRWGFTAIMEAERFNKKSVTEYFKSMDIVHPVEKLAKEQVPNT